MPRRSAPARVLAVVAAIAVVAATGPVSASAGERDSARERRREVQRRRAEVAAELDALRATDAEVAGALDAIAADLAARRAEADNARRAAEVALAEREGAVAAEAAVGQRIDTLQAQLRDLAIDAYIHGPGKELGSFLESSSLSEAARREALLGFTANRQEDVLDELRAAEEDLAAARAAAEAAAQAAAQRLETSQAKLAEVEAARARQLQLANSVQARLDHALSEAASLASVDQQLAAQIAESERALARRVGPVGRSGGGRRIGNVRTTWVRGIEVNVEIADELDAMLGAAEADGIRLGGGGYRDPNQQIETRRRNCGTSDYAVYDMPPSQCSPPTARPGTSMHEQGLAIDFTYNGSAISSRGSPAYRWLDANAGRYGFHNLPGEPWHWSTNGN